MVSWGVRTQRDIGKPGPFLLLARASDHPGVPTAVPPEAAPPISIALTPGRPAPAPVTTPAVTPTEARGMSVRCGRG